MNKLRRQPVKLENVDYNYIWKLGVKKMKEDLGKKQDDECSIF